MKLRWRVLGKGWNDRQGVSLTAGMDGGDVRVLTDATSHVIWLNDRQLYAWRLSELALFADDGGRSNRVARLAPDLVTANVHMRHLPPGATAALGEAIFDTPYRETVDLVHCDARTGAHEVIASFANHRPARGPFRCDLHPCPSEDGRTVIVTSMNDGGPPGLRRRADGMRAGPIIARTPSGSSRSGKASRAARSETDPMAGAMDPRTTSSVSDGSISPRSAGCRARHHSQELRGATASGRSRA